MPTKRRQVKRSEKRTRFSERRNPKPKTRVHIYGRKKIQKKVTQRSTRNPSKYLPLLAPKNAGKELERYLQLANMKLTEADALEEPLEPPSLTEAIKRERSADKQEWTKYDELGRVVEHMRNADLIRAKREQFARDLAREISAALSLTTQQIFSHYHLALTKAEGSELELYELRHFVQGTFSNITWNVSLGGADAPVAKWRIGVSHVYDVNSEGRISVNLGAWGPFEEALKSIDARRVQRCSICEKYFYAPRKDQTFCSKRCGRTKRMRTWRRDKRTSSNAATGSEQQIDRGEES